jgi:alpha-L-fucosidase
MAYYYNKGLERHDGKQDVVFTIKKFRNHGIWVDGIATRDMERDRADSLMPEPWQTDTSIGPWGYHAVAKYRSVNTIVDELVDIVSKNGNMLLNVPPKADGTLDAETERILREIGRWLDINGEAIYGTRPWSRCCDGDLRFTQKKGRLYVIALKLPAAGGDVVVPAAALGEKAGKIDSVRMLGHKGRLSWRLAADGSLAITPPLFPPCEHAWSFEIRR